FSWGNKFSKHALREWRHEQSRQGAVELTQTMTADWWPSSDALEILENADINRAFIEDAVPEFILYWRERDAQAGAWNTKFVDHIRRQWARFSASFGLDDVPRPIAENWGPSAECFDILQLAEIDEDYARGRIPEFILYWKDSGQARASWNTVFLQFIKQDWARRLQTLRETDAGQAELAGNTGHAGHTKDRQFAGASQQRLKEKFQRFTDRSWAE
ncbi:MAG: DnaT-like ssDNA-binding domain-containing protein, partial [Pseudohongiellaceae bacterium]